MLEVVLAVVSSATAGSVVPNGISIDSMIGIIGTLMSLAGLIIGIYTLVKVQGVEKAQVEARKFTQKLLGVNNIESDYSKMMKFLSGIPDDPAKTLLVELSVRLGSIQGIRKALSASGHGDENTTVVLEKGYFSIDFLSANIDGSMFSLDIITGRSQMISNFSVMEKLRIACERGVKVRLITLCENSHPHILEDSLQTVAFPPPTSPEEYRDQLKQCTKDIVEKVKAWSDYEKSNFNYGANQSVPRLSSVRTDDFINLGFLQLYRDAQPKNTSEREYIKIPTNTETGKVILNHFDCVWKTRVRIIGHED